MWDWVVLGSVVGFEDLRPQAGCVDGRLPTGLTCMARLIAFPQFAVVLYLNESIRLGVRPSASQRVDGLGIQRTVSLNQAPRIGPGTLKLLASSCNDICLNHAGSFCILLAYVAQFFAFL